MKVGSLYINGFITGNYPKTFQGRLTLTSATPVTVSDVTGATTIYLTPYKGNCFSVFTGSVWIHAFFTEKSLALGTLSNNTNYDIFVYWTGTDIALEALAWSGSNTRATSLSVQDGIYVKSTDTSRVYVGSFRTTSTTTTEDSVLKRFLWNNFNRVEKPVRRFETTSSWTYATNSFRQANNSSSNQIDILAGLLEDPLNLTLTVGSSGATSNSAFGVGEDSTTTVMSSCPIGFAPGTGTTYQSSIQMQLVPSSIGRHFYAWLEKAISASVTFFSNTSTLTSGLSGYWYC